MGEFSLVTEDVDQPRSWNQSIDQYLDKNDIHCAEIKPMMGGMSAYVWKLEGYIRDPNSSKASQRRPMKEPCVMKYGDSTFKGLPNMEAPPNRMNYEARALRSKVVADACLKEPSVKVAQVLQSTDEAVVMDWGGETEMRKAFLENKSLDVSFLASNIGKWVAHMHLAGIYNPEVMEWKNDTIVNLLPKEENILREAMVENGSFDQSTIEKVVKVFRNPAGVQTLIAYDFRPMNTLLRTVDDPNRPIPTIIDWEACAYQDPVFDLRLWCAEAIVLETQHGDERRMLSSFLQAYRKHAAPTIVTKDFICKLALMVGSMWLMLMPCAIWDVTTEEDGKRWRSTALEYVKAGVDQDMAWIAKTPLAPLLG